MRQDHRTGEAIDARDRIGCVTPRGPRPTARFDRRVRGHRRRASARTAIARCSGLRGDSTACAAPLEVSPDEMRRRPRASRPTCGARSAQAARNIARVAFRQIPQHFDLDVAPGVSIEQRVEPLARVGCYVPGGRFPLPSSLLMTAVPARVAGVRDDRRRLPAARAGRHGGGARGRRHAGCFASAARTPSPRSPTARATIPRVDKIVGPGQPLRRGGQGAGRRATARSTSTPARPRSSIVAGAGRPAWIAADLIAQAEHDPDARAILITWSRRLAVAWSRPSRPQAAGREIVRQSLAAHGASSSSATADEAMALANRIAPEHLVVDRESLLDGPLIAGAVFVGP